MRPETCGAVYVQLGEQPELDRLEKCPREPVWRRDRCTEHLSQLDWVRRDADRLAAYNEQVRLYDVSQQLKRQAEEREAKEQREREAIGVASAEQEGLL